MLLKKITLSDQEIVCQQDESALDALLLENINIPFGCRHGDCQSCMIRSLKNAPPADAQKGLKEALRHQNYFLACLCHPKQDVTISVTAPTDLYTEATVIEKQLLNAETVLLTLKCQKSLDYYAGQFVNLKHSDGLTTR